MIELFWVVALAVFIVSVWLTLKPSQYQPDKIFLVHHNTILVGNTPLARLADGMRKRVERQSITKIQIAGNIVTLFNLSGNAIDIALPRKHLVAPLVMQQLGVQQAILKPVSKDDLAKLLRLLPPN